MIKRIKKLNHIEEIVKNAAIIREFDPQPFRKMMLDSFTRDDIYIGEERVKGELLSFMFATIENFDGENSAFIQVGFSKNGGHADLLLADLILWAKSNNLKTIFFMTKRNPKGFERKYNFKECYKVMKRSI